MKSKSLLTEAIASALLFVICALVAVSLLLSGYVTSRKSGEMIEAIEIGRSVVEQLRLTPVPADQPDGSVVTLNHSGLSDKFSGTVYLYKDVGGLLHSLRQTPATQDGGFVVKLVDNNHFSARINGVVHIYNSTGELLLSLRCVTAWGVVS